MASGRRFTGPKRYSTVVIIGSCTSSGVGIGLMVHAYDSGSRTTSETPDLRQGSENNGLQKQDDGL